jgi:purine-binding chemotaxis protein CheW
MADNAAVASHTDKYLTFTLAGGEEYGLDILKVQEIIGIMPITSVPRTPKYVRGVINLRGRVIPVVDLRVKFDIAAPEDTERTCIVVVQFESKTGLAVMGVVVDEVSEVVDIAAEQIEETPEFGADVETGFVLGIGKVGSRVVMLLDIDKVLSTSEVRALRKVVA